MEKLKEWIQDYSDLLYSYAYLKTGSKEVAEDILQDTFLAAFKSAKHFQQNSSEKTWLMSILKHKIIDYYRKKDLLKNTESYLKESELSFNQLFFEDGFSTAGHWRMEAAPQQWMSDSQADEALLRTELAQIIQGCIEKIPLKLRPVFFAKFIEEQDSKEICKELEISSTNYWVMVHRAKLLMRACLEKNYYRKKI